MQGRAELAVLHRHILAPTRHAPGKPARVRCVQLDQINVQVVWKEGQTRCMQSFQPSEEMCGQSAEEALIY